MRQSLMKLKAKCSPKKARSYPFIRENFKTVIKKITELEVLTSDIPFKVAQICILEEIVVKYNY